MNDSSVDPAFHNPDSVLLHTQGRVQQFVKGRVHELVKEEVYNFIKGQIEECVFDDEIRMRDA